MTALKLALKNRYGDKAKRRHGSIHFADLLHHMVTHDGLTANEPEVGARNGRRSLNRRSQTEPSGAGTPSARIRWKGDDRRKA